MAIGDTTVLRAARADLARTRLETIKQQGGIADLLSQLGAQATQRTKEATRVTEKQAAVAKRAEFEKFRGEFGVATEAGTVTPEMNRRALELGIKRPDIVRAPKELTNVQKVNELIAELELEEAQGRGTPEGSARLAKLRADRRAPVTDRPTPISITLGEQAFQQLKDLTELGQGGETPEEVARIQSIPNRVGSFIAQLGFDNFKVGFGELASTLDEILPDTRTVTTLSESFLGFGGGEEITETDPLDIAEKMDMLLTAKDAISEILSSGQSPQQQKTALRAQEAELAKQIGAESAQKLIDFILRAQQ